MGAQNVGLVFARWGALNHAPFRVLAYMALRSLDSGNPPIFYAGRDEIALALGKPIPEPGPEFEKRLKANRELAKKIIGDLSKAGAITTVTQAMAGQNAVYELHLFRAELSYPQEAGGNPVPPSGGNPLPPTGATGGNPVPPSGGKPVPPLGVSKSIKAFRGVPRIAANPYQQPAPSAHTREDEKPDEISETNSANGTAIHADDCPTCQTALDPDGSCFTCRTPARKGIYA